jgi:hypothetical protein
MKPKEALASHEWETWDSGEADAEFETAWRELGPPISA